METIVYPELIENIALCYKHVFDLVYANLLHYYFVIVIGIIFIVILWIFNLKNI